jgi:HSP20 family molecular chaperone IbpA
MAFFLTPRFAPTGAHCGPSFCAPRPAYRQPAPAPVPSFIPFLSQVEEILADVEREARRVAHAQRQQRKRIFRARFDVREIGNGYEVEGELPGFEQENISIEVTDEHTLKVAGKQSPKETKTEAKASETLTEKLDGVTLNEVDKEDNHSDTASHKSHQPTVEDDYEDLGAETSSTVSEAPSEPKGKEKAVEPPVPQQQAPTPASQEQQQQSQDHNLLSERQYGSFERNFQFPDRIDAAGVRATLRNGVLSISVPKAPVPSIKNITIQ